MGTGEEECCHSSELLLSLESQRLSFYCKIIKNELVTAGVVEEEKFVSFMIQLVYNELTASYSPITLDDEQRAKSIIENGIRNGISFLLSVHCIQRKRVSSVTTLSWYGIQGIAQSVIELTNEEREMEKEPIHLSIINAVRTKEHLEEVIASEKRFREYIQKDGIQTHTGCDSNQYLIVTDMSSDVYCEIDPDGKTVSIESSTPLTVLSPDTITDGFKES